MDYSQLEDDALLKQISTARPKALDELYARYSRLVFSIAMQMLGEKSSAEEVTLDVFMKVWQKADTYRPRRGSVRVWLTSMARYRAIDVLRKNGVRLDAQRKFWAETSAQPISSIGNPESVIDRSSRKRRVRKAIARLNEPQRDVLELAYFKGLSQSEIAQLRNLPLGTVKSRIRSAIGKLRELLAEEMRNE